MGFLHLKWLLVNHGLPVISVSLMRGVLICMGNNRRRRLCAPLTGHFYASIKWVGAECNLEKIPRAKMALQEHGTEFKVVFCRFFFDSTGHSGNLGGLVSGRKRFQVNTLFMHPSYECENIFCTHPTAVNMIALEGGQTAS